jgi:hypothetical protein|nr:hypothetical protein [uncultured Mediterranean phage uvMED]BAR37235.1 hypothetical protein [uncultured Mediterranean phage uvMED]
MKKYIINSMPVMSRDCTIYAKNEDEAWEIYYGNQKGKIQFHEPEYSDINDYVDPELKESEDQ